MTPKVAQPAKRAKVDFGIWMLKPKTAGQRRLRATVRWSATVKCLIRCTVAEPEAEHWLRRQDVLVGDEKVFRAGRPQSPFGKSVPIPDR